MLIREHHVKAAELLGRGVPQERAAEQVGVSTRALQKWCVDPDFVALKRRMQEAFLDRAIDSIVGNADIVALTVVNIATGKIPCDAGTRLKAAQWCLERSAEVLGGAREQPQPEVHNHLHLEGLGPAELAAVARGRTIGGAS